MLSTSDGDRSWTNKNVSNNFLRSIAFLNEENGYVVGDSKDNRFNLYRTSDKGETWKPVNQIYPDIHRIKKFKDKLYLVGKSGSLIVIGS